MLTNFLKLFKADPADGNSTFNITTMLNDNWDKLEAFVKKLIGLQEITMTTGTAPTYAAELANFEMVDGRRITVKFNVASTQASTLSINGDAAGGLKKPGGSDMTNIKAGIYTFVVDSGNFIVQGEGGEYGTASPAETLSGYTVGTESGVENGTLSLTGDATTAHVLAPKTFYSTNAKSKQTGTMPNRGSVGTVTLTAEGAEYTIQEGWHSGLGKVKVAISNAIAAVIKAGAVVGGITGTFTADATALASQMLSGVTAYVNGLKVTGTIPSKGVATITPGTANQTIAAGQFLSGVQTILGDANLLSSKILTGTTIFTVPGSAIDGSSMKKYASGTTATSSGILTVTGLAFTPSVVSIRSYPANVLCGPNFVTYGGKNAIQTNDNQPGNYYGTAVTINAGGFSCNVGGATGVWMAWE